MNEDVIETEVVKVGDTSALAVLNSSEIDQQIATAKRWPRSIKTFHNEARALVTLTEEVAGDCLYALPRGGKTIEGASVRFAEMIVSAWGNVRCGARPMGEEAGFITAQGFFFDLEKNVAITTEVRRKITDKFGKRYNEDMINTTINAACSIARRNAVLQGIPKALWNELYMEARKCAVGDAKTLVSKRADLLAYFQKMHVTPEMILALLEIKGVEDIGLDELATLRGIATAIKEGSTTVEKAFAPKEEPKEQRAESVKPAPKKEEPKEQPDNPATGEVAMPTGEEITALLTDLCEGDAAAMDMMIAELSKPGPKDKPVMTSMKDLAAASEDLKSKILTKLKEKMRING